MSSEISYWWRVTTLIWIMLLIGHVAWWEVMSNSGGSRGRVQGVWNPPIRPYACSRQDNTPLFNLLLLLMQRVLHLTTELNSKNIKKCNTLPWSVCLCCKAVFSSPLATGVQRLRNIWSSLWEVICHKKVQQSFLNQSLDPPIQNSWIRPCQPTNKHYLKWPNERPGHLFNLRVQEGAFNR